MSLSLTPGLNLAHADTTPSPWVVRWSPLIAPGAEVLDLACGHGRHMRYLAEKAWRPVGVDRDPLALAQAQAWGEALCADVENQTWPWPGRVFGAVVITNYLWRPLWPQILASLAPQGVLICETFAQGQETVGRPRRADFLLRHGELLQRCENLHIVAYENGFHPQPEKFVQRIAAVRPDESQPKPVRYPLSLE
ncbi:MAG: class I SAM-dependent methyltransferase [Betaproteobacteria bacterium]|nr:class I SAM-dependent methyltransferase [Betaproteobacteria bacterium]NBY04786.1 class I SAM-dependent methyltransferase [Betaproteobacteria bacterium]